MTSMKTCCRCKRTLPLVTDNFHRDRYKKDGFSASCNACRYGKATTKTNSTRPDFQNLSNTETENLLLKTKIDALHQENHYLREQHLRELLVKEWILGAVEKHSKRETPEWMNTSSDRVIDGFGIPVHMMSDQHIGEVVDANQIGGVNQYDMDIATTRWKNCTEITIKLAMEGVNHKAGYPGIVLAFGGDGVTGCIHDELLETNEVHINPAVLACADLMSWSIKKLLEVFPRVFVPCVVGNHGRMSHKPRYKNIAYTNFDWLAYHFAARDFRGDNRVIFQIADGSDTQFSVYGHRFLMTHGNQFRGGDGIIGSIGPVFRGDAKKRAKQSQVNQNYDTLMIGHFHQLRMDTRIIQNGSLIGYNEFAFGNNFPYEKPQQALFFVHPRHGICLSMPVFPDLPSTDKSTDWLTPEK